MKLRIYSLLFVVVATLFFVSPTQAQSQKDIIGRLDATLGMSLPSEYQAKFRDFVKTNKVMCDAGSNAFIEKFIIDQMKANLNISKQSQLLFVWNAIYHAITGKYIYTGEDGNDKLLNDYTEVMDEIDACEKKFRSSYIAYTKQRSAEARHQSAEARHQSAQARQQSAQARQQSIRSTNNGLVELKKFYKIREYAYDKEIEETKEYAKHVIQNCKEYNIDYKKELTPEMLKFYGIE
jgi:hypothetical protein